MLIVAALALVITPPPTWKQVEPPTAKGIQTLGQWVSQDPFSHGDNVVVWRAPYKGTAVEFVANNHAADASWKSGGPIALCHDLKGIEAVWDRTVSGKAIEEHSVYVVKDGYAYIATYTYVPTDVESDGVVAVRSLCP